MSLPETSVDDLRRMGITPEVIKAELERHDHKIDGIIVGYFLPGDNHGNDQRIRRARNNLKADWKLVTKGSPQTITEERWQKLFPNFDGDEPLETAYDHVVPIASGNDYTQDKAFDISVNANIVLGRSGPLPGFHAAMSAEEIKKKSKTATVERNINFPLTVPAHEGRMTYEDLWVLYRDDIFESSLRVEGTVGIEVQTGDFTPNVFFFFYNIEAVFSNSAATSLITRRCTYTDVSVSVSKVDGAADAQDATTKADADLVEYMSFDFDQPEPALESPDDVGIAFADDKFNSSTEPSTSVAAVIVLKVKIQFYGVKPEVPVTRRRPLTQQFWGRLRFSTIPFNRPLGTPSYVPDNRSATISVNYELAKIAKEKLKAEITKVANQMKWEGKVKITFS